MLLELVLDALVDGVQLLVLVVEHAQLPPEFLDVVLREAVLQLLLVRLLHHQDHLVPLLHLVLLLLQLLPVLKVRLLSHLQLFLCQLQLLL